MNFASGFLHPNYYPNYQHPNRRRGKSPADTNSRHFRELEARYLRMGFSPKAVTSAAMREMRVVLGQTLPARSL